MDINGSIDESFSWLEWYLMRESAPKINTQAKKKLFETFDSTKTEDEIKSELLKHKETVFIFKQNFGKNKINFFHNLSLIGGSFYNPQEHFGAIQGIDEGLTSVITPDMSQLLEVSTIAAQVPSMEEYSRMKSIEDYRASRTPREKYFTARNFIPVPPFMLNDLNEVLIKYEGDSTQALIKAIELTEEFDQKNQEIGGETNELATESCTNILNWLYLASKGKINSTPTIACSTREVRKHFDDLQRIHRIERASDVPQNNGNFTADNIQKPLEIIAASSSSTQDFLSKLTQIHTSNQDKSSNSFGKLSDKIQNMFLVASSRGNVVPTTPNDQATNFFKSTNFSKAQQYLENYLEEREIECAIPTAVANLWLQGCLLWLNPLTPSGLATSVIACKNIIFNDTIHEGILLDFSTKHEITKNSLTKLTKTQVMYPNSTELMLERIDAIAAFAELFFTEKVI